MNRFFQAIIALSGLVISVLLGYQSIEAQNRAAENERLQARYAFITLFSDQTGNATAFCNPGALFIVASALENLPVTTADEKSFKARFDEQNQQVANELALCLEKKAAEQAAAAPPAPPSDDAPRAEEGLPPPPPAAAAPNVARVGENATFRAKEAVAANTPASTQAPSKLWYAVLASYKAGSENKYVLEDIQKFQQAISSSGQPDLKLEVYRTAISDHYALVLTPPDGSKEAAQQLASMARKRGWALDAFVQDNRDWTRCAVPATAATLSACTRAGS